MVHSQSVELETPSVRCAGSFRLCISAHAYINRDCVWYVDDERENEKIGGTGMRRTYLYSTSSAVHCDFVMRASKSKWWRQRLETLCLERLGDQLSLAVFWVPVTGTQQPSKPKPLERTSSEARAMGRQVCSALFVVQRSLVSPAHFQSLRPTSKSRVNTIESHFNKNSTYVITAFQFVAGNIMWARVFF